MPELPAEVSELRRLLNREMAHQGVLINAWHAAYEHALRHVPFWKRSRVRRQAASRLADLLEGDDDA